MRRAESEPGQLPDVAVIPTGNGSVTTSWAAHALAEGLFRKCTRYVSGVDAGSHRGGARTAVPSVVED